MTAVTIPLIIEQNADFMFKFTWKNKITGPYDLTGWQGRMMVRQYPFTAAPIMELSTDDGTLILGSGQYNIQGNQPHTVTAPLVPGDYLYDLLLIDTLGEYFRFSQGPIPVLPAVTYP